MKNIARRNIHRLDEEARLRPIYTQSLGRRVLYRTDIRGGDRGRGMYQCRQR